MANTDSMQATLLAVGTAQASTPKVKRTKVSDEDIVLAAINFLNSPATHTEHVELKLWHNSNSLSQRVERIRNLIDALPNNESTASMKSLVLGYTNEYGIFFVKPTPPEVVETESTK